MQPSSRPGLNIDCAHERSDLYQMVVVKTTISFSGNIQVFVVIGNPIAGEAAAPCAAVSLRSARLAGLPSGFPSSLKLLQNASRRVGCLPRRIRPQVTLRMRGCFKAVGHWQNCAPAERLPEPKCTSKISRSSLILCLPDQPDCSIGIELRFCLLHHFRNSR